tara:strand:- start:551 stop:913 length:363 start_codon:yes stop_codon:yes gene_type:complete
MINTCIASIKRTGLSREEVIEKFYIYVSLQSEANIIASSLGEHITNRVNNYKECTCSFDVTHDNWNVVSKACFALGNFFGIHGVPIQFDISDASPKLLEKCNKYFDKRNNAKKQTEKETC